MSVEAKVFVVDDDPAVRDSLGFLLQSVGLEVEAYADAAAMIDRARRPIAGCLVADLRLVGMSGLDMYDELRSMGVALPTVIITGHGDVTVAVRALKAGVLDFLEKPFPEQAILNWVRKALDIEAQQREDAERLESIRERFEGLTPREKQVMKQVVAGRLNKQIAGDLDLSPKTIEVHRSHVMSKMAAASLADLVRMAVRLEEARVKAEA